MAKISNAAASIAVSVALLLPGMAVGLQIDSARADDNCVAAPGAAAPDGQHWYYRTDRVKHRKCWYLHAIMPLATHGVAKPRASLSELAPSATIPQSTNTASAAQPAADPSDPWKEASSAQPVPHVTVLAVKPVTNPFVGTPSASQAAIPEQTDEPPMPQISPDDANVPVSREAAPESRPDPATVPAATEPDHHAFLPPDTAATSSVRTHAADRFFLLALALAIAAGLIAFFGKMAGLTRTPRLSDHPDDAWRRVSYGEGAPFLAPEQPHGPVDLDAHEWIKPSLAAPADLPAARPQDAELKQSEEAGSTRKDIELALRVLLQARESSTQT
jgi:hypothetical protein